MQKSTISISNIDSARAFVAMTNKHPGLKLVLHEDEYDIDAHSIIGILSLDLSKPLELIIDGDIDDSFMTDLAPYTV